MAVDHVSSKQFADFLKKFDDFVISVNQRFDKLEAAVEENRKAIEHNAQSIGSLCKVFEAVISDKAA